MINVEPSRVICWVASSGSKLNVFESEVLASKFEFILASYAIDGVRREVRIVRAALARPYLMIICMQHFCATVVFDMRKLSR